ncbi:rhomboid family intramembrane serine protease [Clostridium fungisolvens]|uniref:Rhomboid protease GlpG n=1 Tax=Clostridium fungisolvens TaxID=1604897 RepID=A0A6V8SEE4_9CLOT|nr:rhomboid family intramembrane serine protease [Clostridium fungisolvens]GFP74922.1 Rhomboid protease GlpG [Clostridium fungisolvens]
MKVNENSILQFLVKEQGFFVEEYYCNPLEEKRWIALREIESGIYAVIVSEEKNETVSAEYAGYYLREKGQEFALINVVITDGNYSGTENQVFYSRVIYDRRSNGVTQYERNGEFVYNCIKDMTERGTKKISLEGKSKITFGLIVINVVVFLITALVSGNFGDIDTSVLVYFGAKQNELIQSGQYYRLITAMFLHGGIIHIAFNMYALYSLGNLIENIYGKWKYLLIYFLAGILSTTTSYIFSPYVSVGASGAIFGLFGAAVVFGLKERNRIGKNFLTEIATVIGMNIIIGLSSRNIDNFAHFGGLLGGIVIAFLLYDNKKFRQQEV